MKYYYELLESYNDLKKRKFSLSLVEQSEDAVAKANSAISQAKSAQPKRADAIQISGANGEIGWIWVSGQNKNVNFSKNPDKTWPIRPEESDENFQELVGFFSGQGEETTDTDTLIEKTPEQMAVEAEIEKFSARTDSLGANQNGIWQTDTNSGVRLGHSNPVASRSELQQRTIQGLDQENPKELSTAKELQEIPNRITSSELDPNLKIKSLKTMNKVLDIVDKIEKGEDVSDQDLRFVAENATIDKRRGVLFNDVFYVWKTKSAAAAGNPFTKSLNLIQTRIDAKNKEYSKLESPKPFIPSIPTSERDISKEGRLYNIRGIGSEKLMSMSLKFSSYRKMLLSGDGAGAKKVKKEMGEVYQQLLESGTEEDIREAFRIGNDTRLGRIIADLESGQDAENIEAMKSYLMSSYGLKESVVESLLDLGGDKPGVALAIMLNVERKFTEDLFGDTENIKVKVTGQDDSYSYGRKGDLLTQNKNIGGHYNKILGDTKKKSNHFGGSIQNDADNVVIELKTTNSVSNDVKAGTTADKRFSDIDLGLGTENEKRYMGVIDQSMEAITPGSSKLAKKGRDAIRSRVDKFSNALNFSEGGKNYGNELIDTWATSNQHKSNSKDVAKKAKEYLNLQRSGNYLEASEDQLEAWESVSSDIYRATTNDYLLRNSSDGILNEEATAYVLHRTIASCGSEEPCLRVTRALEEGKQFAYDNNEEMTELAEKLGSGELRVKKTSGALEFIDKSGKRIPLRCKITKNGWVFTKPTSSLKEITSTELGESVLLEKFFQAQSELFRHFAKS